MTQLIYKPSNLQQLGQPLKSDLWSDLHYEKPEDVAALDVAKLKNPESQLAMVAGDMAHDPALAAQVIEKITTQYDVVLFTDGNAEQKGLMPDLQAGFSLQAIEGVLNTGTASISNAYYLNKKACIIGDTAIVGANGHWDYEVGAKGVSREAAMQWNAGVIKDRFGRDGSQVVQDYRAAAIEDAAALKNIVAALNADPSIRQIVMMTHTVPDARLLTAVPEGSPVEANTIMANSRMADVFNADSQGKIGLWVFGHQHALVDETLTVASKRNVRFVANPQGYASEQCRIRGGELYRPKQLII